MEARWVSKTLANHIAEDIGGKAYRALLEEVYTTPKPGLVDLYSNGAHSDMDVHTFERSAEALYPWFVQMAMQGYCFCGTPEELFLEIRKTGLEAEKAMYRVTNGVNTHKGLIFTLGIFCAAAGRCSREYRRRVTLQKLIDMEQQMTSRILGMELLKLMEEEDDQKILRTNGEKNLLKYGASGIRGEAIQGYPSVINLALPVLYQGIVQKRNWNKIKLQTLLTLMSNIQDSNVLSRGNPEILKQVQKEANDFLEKGGAYSENAMHELMQMDEDYIRRNISAGGCADLLATTIFLEMFLKD